MLIFMFSLTGIPPLAGFMGKFFIFKSAVEAGLVWLAVVGVIFSAISAYFYLRVIMVMYMSEPNGTFELTNSPSLALALAISVDLRDRDRRLSRRPARILPGHRSSGCCNAILNFNAKRGQIFLAPFFMCPPL